MDTVRQAPDPNLDEALLIPLSTPDEAALEQVGGKAASLIRLQQAGFDVPSGVVLTARFFEPWLSQVQTTGEWLSAIEILQSNGAGQPNLHQRTELARLCGHIKSLAFKLPISGNQCAQIDTIEAKSVPGLYVVRSSSPEEDLAGTSFAGLYETVLGVDSQSLTDAIRTCFCSCLDARVLLYKYEMNFEKLSPTIAVIVQRQVESVIAGVAFSLNPLTNDFDEILINASWGLGEALVTGDITPDTAVVDKVTNNIITYRVGSKGGDRSEEESLAGHQITKLADTVKRIDSLYDQPVDIEWAFADGKLYVLQARPITAYVPLHTSLQTAPGAPRHLYMDGYLTDGLTMSAATTPMSDDVFSLVYRLFFQWMMNVSAEDIDMVNMGIHPQSSRLYVDVSMYMHLLGRGERLAGISDTVNPIMAGIFSSPNIEQYRPAEVPSHLRITRLLGYLPGILWRTRRAMTVLFGPMFNRDRFDVNYEQTLKDFDEWVTRPMNYSQSVADCVTEGMMRVGSTIMISSYPAFMYFFLMTRRIKGLVDSNSAEQIAWVETICGRFEDDMIVQMGLMIYEMSTLLPKSEFDDIEALTAKLEQRSLPEAFLSCWDEFVRRYGCRGPLEMELANPKYAESPKLALRQMATVAAAGREFNPQEMARKQALRREQSYNKLLETLPPRKARRLTKYYSAITRYAGTREMFKHHIMQVYSRVRKLLLHQANELVREGRLDRRDQIFELTIDDVDRAMQDHGMDIRAAVEERGAFSRKLKSLVRHFPMFIDSRGRILRKRVENEEGALVGAAISPGVARGPIKVLNDPFEKEVQPGDVLVAVTTDPGWTPLFVSAAAVILEIGGELQHGALVAREYGKPCVSGIQDVTTEFEDGQIVEVDGDTGVIRFVDAP